nr:hypothetical protein [Tanacetum cinerariifolium]
EYAVLWNNWYTKCEECKFDKISYDKAYNDMQQKVERLQAQLRDLKGLVYTAKTRRPQTNGNIRNVRVPSASKSSAVKEIVTVEDHRRTLLLSKNWKTMSSECNNIKLASLLFGMINLKLFMILNFCKAKDHDIKFYCSNDIKLKIKILDHKHAEGTAKNSQDNKVLRHEVKTYAMTTP